LRLSVLVHTNRGVPMSSDESATQSVDDLQPESRIPDNWVNLVMNVCLVGVGVSASWINGYAVAVDTWNYEQAGQMVSNGGWLPALILCVSSIVGLVAVAFVLKNNDQ